ncbi:MAG TPA: DinB family protein [Candidatus Acidoferrum sp.]|nr:DinB family protein [Candidatus Acidoferrum sp.]
MSIYGGKEMAAAFRTVRKNTLQIAEDIPEDKYNFVPAPGVKPVASQLAHIATVTRLWPELAKEGLTTLVGFDFLSLRERLQAEETKKRTKAELLDYLRKEGEAFAVWLESLSDEFLAVGVIDGDGKTVKTRFERVLGAKEHEMHHRGQLMLIERQLGITPHLTRQTEERLKQLRAAKAGS